MEAAWHYRHRPRLNQRQKGLQRTSAPKVAETAWRAQERLIGATCYSRLRANRLEKVVTALARELAGFVWAIGVETEKQLNAARAA